jgi:hypothetical protein
MSEGSGSKVFDRSKYQNNGDVVGAVWVEPFESASEGAWIKADWNINTCKRMKITIDSSKVDADLTDFPVYLNISTASGIGDVDVSAIFDELGAEDLKLAVATFSGIQCYVEVVSWDEVGEVAELWVKVPYISSSEDTIIYIYYDVTHADNTSFVGITGSTPAEAVWDSNFKLVCHMNDNPDTSHIMDSTSNNNDGTKLGAGTPIEAMGQIGKAQNFGVGHTITTPDSPSLDIVNALTIEAWFKHDVGLGAEANGWYGAIRKALAYRFGWNGYTDGWSFYIYSGTAIKSLDTTNKYVTADTDYYMVAVYDRNTLKIYQNNVEIGSKDVVNFDIDINASDLTVGAYGNSWDGLIDEWRISALNRSVAWRGASYQTQNDSLVTFSGVEQTYSKLLPDWRFGGALAFDGVDDKVTVSYIPTYQIPVTISAWINIPKLQVDQEPIIHVGTVATNGYGIYVGRAGNSTIQVLIATIGWVSSGINPTINTWQHVVITIEYYSASQITVSIYIDGNKIHKEQINNPIAPTTQTYIGSDGTNYSVGNIDDIRIYKRILTLEEIRLLYLKKVK